MVDSNSERIFNIFLDVERDSIVSIGVQTHTISGNDDFKTAYLQRRVDEDSRTAVRFLLPSNVGPVSTGENYFANRASLKWTSYLQLCELGKSIELFEPILDMFDASKEPVLVVTPVVDGEPRPDNVVNIRNSNIEISKLEFSAPQHFLTRYTENDTFLFSALLNDDFFKPIKLLANNGFIVSAVKLLLSAIDTFAFLEYGDEKDNFKRFVKTYFHLTNIGVTENELWELRNGMVHMSNYESRQVKQGKVKSLVLIRGKFPPDVPAETFDGKRLDVDALYFESAAATERWGNELFGRGIVSVEEFVSRYETLVCENHAWMVKWE